MSHILIADDHAIVRYGTLLILKGAFPEIKVSEAENLNEVLDILARETIDMLILDINIPGGNNLQMIDAIKLRQPNVKILVFSGYDEKLYAHRYLQRGAHGYMMKLSPEEELIVAVQTILFRQEIYASSELKQYMLYNMAGNKIVPSANPLLDLSNRETEVMQLLIKGMGLAEIAAALNLQVSTVSTYKTRIFEKLKVTNVVELAEMVRTYFSDND
jgi:two-component system invasion response regulator UvrY